MHSKKHCTGLGFSSMYGGLSKYNISPQIPHSSSIIPKMVQHSSSTKKFDYEYPCTNSRASWLANCEYFFLFKKTTGKKCLSNLQISPWQIQHLLVYSKCEVNKVCSPRKYCGTCWFRFIALRNRKIIIKIKQVQTT